MASIEIDWRPDKNKLRNFSIIFLVASVLLSLLLYFFKGLPIRWAFAIASLGIFISITCYLFEAAARVVYISLTLITLPIGLAVNFVLLSAFYFVIITPLALFFRLVGRDPLNRKFDADAKSYWVRHRSGSEPERYFRQF